MHLCRTFSVQDFSDVEYIPTAAYRTGMRLKFDASCSAVSLSDSFGSLHLSVHIRPSCYLSRMPSDCRGVRRVSDNLKGGHGGV